MYADLIIYRIKALYTPYHQPPVRGKDMNDIKTIHQAYLAIKDGKILGFGEGDGDTFLGSETELIDAKGAIIIPGWIDSHTHLVHAGSREDEYEQLQQGVPYLSILEKGGGILGTVEKTRKASFDALYHQAYHSLDRMILHGVTTVESKSGYGLSLEHEMKQLRINQRLNDEHPMRVISTYMAAHAVPREYKGRKEDYIQSMMHDMKFIASNNLAEAVDVFCEEGVFSIEETRRILEEAKRLGFTIKMHADEIHSLGGAGLGVELGCTSVDHVMAISDEDIKKLSQSTTVANVLPGTSFYLKKAYAPARKMIDQGVILSIAGDYNPGSCPTENFQFILQLASNHMGLTPEEILHASTINAAYHLKIDHTKGSIEVGKDADFVLLQAPNLTYVLYHFGVNHVKDVYIAGKKVVSDQKIVRD
ncbi:MAG TPA: imidazolonepropionase [Acholeplasmataceae bacterium]|nr:imidazolonepropionase [Acholeplasmataceae bacterium]